MRAVWNEVLKLGIGMPRLVNRSNRGKSSGRQWKHRGMNP
jgi:hypothetical protein